MRLNIIAPTLSVAAAPGMGTVLGSLIRHILAKHSDVRIFFNRETARQFPEWRSFMRVVRTLPMRPTPVKGLAVAVLEAGFRAPSDGVCWFPNGPILPFRFRGRAVSTLHDTLEKDFPHAVPLAERVFRKLILGRTLARAHIVTDSLFSQRQILHHYRTPSTVIPLGCEALPEADLSSVPEAPFVFYPANGWAHKNHRFLLETWRRHRELARIGLVFTLGGGADRELGNAIGAARSDGVRIHVTGRVSRAQLHGLYRNSRCTVIPSLYEGFGLPAQEALLAGCPVLLSAHGSLPETVKDGYPLLLPLDSSLWAKTIVQDPRTLDIDWSSFLVSRSWSQVADDYLDFCSRVPPL